jgi:hypothetical protein
MRRAARRAVRLVFGVDREIGARGFDQLDRAQHMHGIRQPVHLVTGLEADGKRIFCRLCGPARRFHCCIDLRQRQPRVVEKDLA